MVANASRRCSRTKLPAIAIAVSPPKITIAPTTESGSPKVLSARGIWLTIRLPALNGRNRVSSASSRKAGTSWNTTVITLSTASGHRNSSTSAAVWLRTSAVNAAASQLNSSV